MKFLCVALLAASVAAWMPPTGTVEQFGPEIETHSFNIHELKGRPEHTLKEIVNAVRNEGVEIEITDEYTDKKSGIYHVWFRQVVDGIPVVNAVGNLNVDKDGHIISNYHRFSHNTKSRPSSQPTLSAVDALAAFAERVIHHPVPADVAVVADLDMEHEVYMEATNYAHQPMYADLRWIMLEDMSLRLVWQVNADFVDAWYDASVDAHDGTTHQLVDFVHWFSYNVYPHFVVDPEDEPDANREIQPELVDPDFSPLGWHNNGQGTIRNTQGNNVRAQENLSGRVNGWENNYRPTPNANDAYDFPLPLDRPPNEYLDAAITNLFYHCNIFHDFLYQYGFDEVSGNFQANNFGRGGRENDPVTAQCQDGSGSNNANFATPGDGSPGRMRMYTWSAWNPRKDGDFDSGIIYHEFAHGLSNRLTGGPTSTGCLTGSQPGGMGEGWGDFIGVMFRTRPNYNRNMIFGTGTYVTSGITIRNWPYSSNRTAAPQLYTNVPGLPIHQIGAVWCTILYEVYWNFVDNYGFDPDWLRGTGGNNMVAQVVVDGMKLQPCRPQIVQARDAILDATLQQYGEAAWCLAWDGFATRGLGVGAPSNAGSNSFDVPSECPVIMQEAGLRGMLN